jgi:hypothetical protein
MLHAPFVRVQREPAAQGSHPSPPALPTRAVRPLRATSAGIPPMLTSVLADLHILPKAMTMCAHLIQFRSPPPRANPLTAAMIGLLVFRAMCGPHVRRIALASRPSHDGQVDCSAMSPDVRRRLPRARRSACRRAGSRAHPASCRNSFQLRRPHGPSARWIERVGSILGGRLILTDPDVAIPFPQWDQFFAHGGVSVQRLLRLMRLGSLDTAIVSVALGRIRLGPPHGVPASDHPVTTYAMQSQTRVVGPIFPGLGRRCAHMCPSRRW